MTKGPLSALYYDGSVESAKKIAEAWTSFDLDMTADGKHRFYRCDWSGDKRVETDIAPGSWVVETPGWGFGILSPAEFLALYPNFDPKQAATPGD